MKIRIINNISYKEKEHDLHTQECKRMVNAEHARGILNISWNQLYKEGEAIPGLKEFRSYLREKGEIYKTVDYNAIGFLE